MPGLAVLLIGASITPSLALEASGVCGGAVGCCGLVRDDCLYQDNKDVTDRILANNAVGRRLWKTYDGGVHNCSDSKGILLAMSDFCTAEVCPSPKKADFFQTCADHSVHSFQADFKEKVTKRNSLQYTVFFVAVGLIFSGDIKMFCTRLPYTVVLLLVGMMLGAIAQSLVLGVDCPMYALRHDRDGDGVVSRAEWDEFVCAGCHTSSFCIEQDTILNSEDFRSWASAIYGTSIMPTVPPATCGNGEAAGGPGCGFSFDELDAPFKLSPFLHEYVSMPTPHGGGHRRGLAADGSGSSSGGGSSSGSGSGSSDDAHGSYFARFRPSGDGKLTADELWTPRCNLLHDMTELKDIDPHVMLVVFLPALLFESACFGIDMGIFRRQKFQILLMAFPAMITASGITALCVYALAPPTWTFWVCWLIGIIASATDPVAVVALLKELGAAKTLGTLIEGESLLNDGSAVVLFVWVRNAIGYDYATLAPEWMRGDGVHPYTGQVGWELVRIVAQMLFMGGALGYAFGWLCKESLRFVNNDKYVEVSTIIGLSYFAFWVSELIVGSSAVLAVVVMGLYMNVHKSSISPLVLHFLHEFYEMIAHILNTVIFLIAGCKLGALLVDTSIHNLYTVGSGSLMMIACIYPIILFARGLAILLHFPLLSRLGTGCTWKEAVVMWWGGLRGSVGLALGLAVHHTLGDKYMWGEGQTDVWGNVMFTTTLDCRDQPNMVLILTVFIVVMTVTINGVTMAPLMKLLKLTTVPADRLYMLKKATKLLRQKNTSLLAHLKEELGEYLPDVDWQRVTEAEDLWGQELAKAAEGPSMDGLTSERAAWMMVLNLQRAYYKAKFEGGILSGNAYKVLEDFMADLAAKAADAEVSNLGALYDREFKKALVRNIEKTMAPMDAYEAGLTYILAQKEVAHLIGLPTHKHEHAPPGDLTGELSVRDSHHHVAGESSSFAQHGMGMGRGVSMKTLSELAKVAKEHEDNVEDMERALKELRHKYPKDVGLYQCMFLASNVRYAELSEIDLMYHEGELLDLDVGPLRKKCEDEIQAMYLLPIRRKAGGDLYLRALGQAHPLMEAYMKRPKRLTAVGNANIGALRLFKSATVALKTATVRVDPAAEREPATEADTTGIVSPQQARITSPRTED